MLTRIKHPAVISTLLLVGLFSVIDFFTRVLPEAAESSAVWSVPNYPLKTPSNVIAKLPGSLNQWLEEAESNAKKTANEQSKQGKEVSKPPQPKDLPGGTRIGNYSVVVKATFESESQRLGLFQIMERETGNSYLRLLGVNDKVASYQVNKIEKTVATLSKGAANSEVIHLDVFSPESYAAPLPTSSAPARKAKKQPPEGPPGVNNARGKTEEPKDVKRAVLTEEERAEFEALLNAPRHSEKDSNLEDENND